MSNNTDDFLAGVLKTARKRPWLWMFPLVFCGVAALMYGLFGPKSWSAVQAFAVRDEMIGQRNPGRFESLDAMKTAQETISKVATSSTVVRKTLESLDKNASLSSIEDLQGAISFSAPNGAEFGKTEILLMTVKNKSAAQAKELVSVLFDELELELRSLRKGRAQSMEKELSLANELTEAEWERVAAELKAIESKVGSDLGDLRSLNDPNSSPGNLGRQLEQIRSELRPANIQLRSLDEQRTNLSRAVADAEEILATPSELLELQPVLRRLKDGLVDAQLRLSSVRGPYTESHTKTVAAKKAVEDTKARIQSELKIALKGLDTQVLTAKNRVDSLREREESITVKLGELANLRVEYGKLTDEYQQRRESYSATLALLERAEALLKAADQVDMIQKTDEAFVGTRASGPGKTMLLIGGIVAGLAIGVGLVFLATPNPSGPAPQSPRSHGNSPGPIDSAGNGFQTNGSTAYESSEIVSGGSPANPLPSVPVPNVPVPNVNVPANVPVPSTSMPLVSSPAPVAMHSGLAVPDGESPAPNESVPDKILQSESVAEIPFQEPVPQESFSQETQKDASFQNELERFAEVSLDQLDPTSSVSEFAPLPTAPSTLSQESDRRSEYELTANKSWESDREPQTEKSVTLESVTPDEFAPKQTLESKQVVEHDRIAPVSSAENEFDSAEVVESDELQVSKLREKLGELSYKAKEELASEDVPKSSVRPVQLDELRQSHANKGAADQPAPVLKEPLSPDSIFSSLPESFYEHGEVDRPIVPPTTARVQEPIKVPTAAEAVKPMVIQQTGTPAKDVFGSTSPETVPKPSPPKKSLAEIARSVDYVKSAQQSRVAESNSGDAVSEKEASEPSITAPKTPKPLGGSPVFILPELPPVQNQTN